jgi:dihydrolipoamide dehydrogenase
MGELAEGADIIVIGGGPAGYTCALRLAQLGKQVTLVDKDGPGGLGGLCLLHGCIPSKALIHAASAFDEVKHLGDLGITVGEVKLDWVKTQEWKNRVIRQLNSGLEALFKQYNIEIVKGTAVFQSQKRLAVTTDNGVRAFEFRKAVIATGSTPRKLAEAAFDGVNILSSREALALDKIPATMAVFGGGYVGIELGTVFAKLGTKVSVIEHGDHILSVCDPEASSMVLEKLKGLGVQFFFNSKAEKCDIDASGVTIHFSSNGASGTSELHVEKVLVAVGHNPTTQGLGIEHAGVSLDERGFIKVDAKLRSSNEDIYAIGDVTGHPMLAHRGYRQGRVAAEVIAGHDVVYDVKVVPAVVFSDPEIASVGLQEHEAKAKGTSVIVGKFPFRALGRALASNAPSGYVKIVADPATHTVLGGTIVGHSAADLIGEVAVAVEAGLMLEDIANTIHTHPTFPEALSEACEVALGSSTHLPKKK